MRESIKRVIDSAACAFAVDEEDRVLAWSEAAVKILGWDSSEVVGHEACQFIEAKDLFGNRWCSRHCGLHEMAHRREPIQTVWLSLKKKSGDYSQFFGVVHAVSADSGSLDARPGSDQVDLVFELQEERR